MKKVNIGLIGAGRIGKIHAESMSRIPEANLLIVADVFAEAAEALATHYDIPAATDPLAVIAHPQVEAVAICSSTDTHAEFIVAAANAGKHIFCEKPIDHDLERIDNALAAVEKASVKLMVGFNRRFDANFMRLKEMVTAGKIGVPHILRIASRDPAPPPIDYIKVSGGIFLDMTIHDFDMARFLMDSEVEEVYAAGGVMVDPAIGMAGDIDTCIITLKFANGAIGAIDNSRQAVYGYDQRVELFGSAGMLQAENNRPSATSYANADHIQTEKPVYFFLERYKDAYREEMRQFVDCVVNDKPSPVSGKDGRAPVVVGMAAWKSYRENRPVRIEEIETRKGK